MWFAIGFVASCIIGVYFAPGKFLLPLALIGIVAGCALFFLKMKWGKVVATALIGLGVGLVWFFGFQALYLQSALAYDGTNITATAEITDYSYETNYGVSADGKIKIDGKDYKVRIYTQDSMFSPGDKVTGVFSMQYTADGGQREPSYHQGKGIFLIARCREITQIERCDKIPAKYFAATLRKNIQSSLDKLFPADTVGFARALLLGDTSKFSDTQRETFSVSGISHVIAVSGMHVSILFSLLYAMCGKQRYLTAVIGIPVLILFAAVAGFTPSIMRACTMQILMIIALIASKEYDPPTALSFALVVMLAVNPLAITSVSLQLSAGCMVGIFLFSGKISNYLLQEKRLGTGKGKGVKAKLTRWFAGSVSVTVSAMTVTTPLCAYYFGLISLVGIVTNLLVLPIVSFIFYGIMASLGVGLLFVPLGQGIAWVVSWAIRYVLTCAKLLSSIPFAAVYTSDKYIGLWLAFIYILLAVLLIQKKKQPILAIICMAIGLCAAVFLSALEKDAGNYCLTVLDVGQGQCVLYECGETCYLIDCGGSNEETAAQRARDLLRTKGISEIDGVVVTHYDTDHAGGVFHLLQWVSTKALYLPDVPDEGDLRQELTDSYGDKILWVKADMKLPVDKGAVSVFTAPEGKDENERSLCVLFQPGNCDILITGDRGTWGENHLMNAVDLPDVEILVAGHHGSDTGTSMAFLNAIQPDHVVISSGKNNIYGLPAPEVLKRLGIFDCQVWRTDRNGTVTFRG